jgi:hypothetical protein
MIKVESEEKAPVKADWLSSPIEREEIDHVVLKADPNKAPGPDGFYAAFYQRCWNLIGDDVAAAVQSFFKSQKII